MKRMGYRDGAGQWFLDSRRPARAFSHWFRRLASVEAIAFVAALSFFGFSTVWGGVDRGAVGKEEVLEQARSLIDQDENNRGNMERAISILQLHGGEHPDEILFPLHLAKAFYLLGDLTADRKEAFRLYEQTGSYARQALRIDPDRPACHYWNGLFLLRKAEHENSIRAFFFVRKAIGELERVRASAPEYDHAGASRVLCLLRQEAPNWTPFGDLGLSIELGREAVRIDPVYPLNRLYLADAYALRGDKDEAIREYRELLSIAKDLPGYLSGVSRGKAESALRSLEKSPVP